MSANVVPLRHGRALYRVLAEEGAGTITSFLPGYELHLAARGQAAKTIEKKLLAARQLAAHLGDPDVNAVTRSHVEGFVAARLEAGKRSSAATTVVALRAFFAYLAVDLGGFDSPMAGITTPTAEEPLPPAVPAEAVAAMLATCEKKKVRNWEDIRDAAILRVFIDTGARLSEVAGLTLTDVLPLDDGRMMLRLWGKGRGGGKRERHVPLGAKAAVALRRYLRVRAPHGHAGAPNLWLGRKGPIKPHGVREMIYRRSERAGQRINPHALRHDWAVKMKSDERNRDADICHLAGWADSKMLARYGRVATASRAVEAFWAHGAPGDQL